MSNSKLSNYDNARFPIDLKQPHKLVALKGSFAVIEGHRIDFDYDAVITEVDGELAIDRQVK